MISYDSFAVDCPKICTFMTYENYIALIILNHIKY